MVVEKMIIDWLRRNGYSREDCNELLDALTKENNSPARKKREAEDEMLKKRDLEKEVTKPEENKEDNTDTVGRETLLPDYMYAEEAAEYLHSNERKLALLRKMGLVKYNKLGKAFIYRKDWLDQFMEDWEGYDMSNPEQIRASIQFKAWKKKHKM